MPLSAGSRLGPYHILAPLGAGGMGEVHRATDTRLKRQVAIKVLPPAMAADPDRLARFQREAEVLASLNHPHIAAVYGLEDADGTKALVMELVEGPTLADRIAQGPIPVDEALPIARQIADALEAAHEQGVVHRDLKPANIKVREDGTVKVLDFGLAKLAETGGDGRTGGGDGRRDLSDSPTLTRPAAMTGMGVVLGTAAYMSPEQARGRAVDKRTDIWAFGAVLYEMLTAVRAFPGDDATEVIAEIVKGTPKWEALPPEVPPSVATLIQRCLEKDRRARVGDIAVARFLLAADPSMLVASPAVPRPPAARSHGRQALPWLLAGVLAGGLVAALLARRPSAAPAVARLQMGVAPADELAGSIASVRPSRTAIAISPDGRRVVFSGVRGGGRQLYLREIDQAAATPIQGTESGIAPFFSPDGRWIGFWADDAIKKVAVAGGPPAVVSEVPAGRGWGASWAEDGTIFFAGAAGLFRVSSAGGTPVPVTTPDPSKGERHLLPQALPGGDDLLFTAMTAEDWETANVVLLSLDERRVLLPGAVDARYVTTGHLVYMKAGTLMAVPFDAGRKVVTGAPVALIEDVMQGMNAPNAGDETGAGQFAVASSGTLVYVHGGIGPIRQRSMLWVDRKGSAHPIVDPAGPFMSPRLSPDGQRVAVAARRGATRTTDVWVHDLPRGTASRLTFESNNNSPVWSPDGKRLVYGAGNLFAIDGDGSGRPERLTTGDRRQTPSSWAPGANTIAFLERPAGGGSAIWALPMDGERKPRLFLESRFNLTHPEFSPDGRWIAYASNESGTTEIYVQAYPGPGQKTRISTTGGAEPVWTRSSREILFRSGTRDAQQFFSAAIRSLSPFAADAPRLLFEAGPGEYDSTTPSRGWDAGADGQRLLLLRTARSTDVPVREIQVVLNWAEELRRLAPAR